MEIWIVALRRGDTDADAARGYLFSTEFQNKRYSDRDFVTILYRTFFNRELDANRYNAWLSQLNSGVSREEVFRGFSNSTEFGNICAQYGIIR